MINTYTLGKLEKDSSNENLKKNVLKTLWFKKYKPVQEAYSHSAVHVQKIYLILAL